MKKKIMPKFLGIVMAIVLVAMAPLFLTACGAPADLGKVAKAAARDYYKNHVDYENFANTTYVYEQKDETKYTQELKYFPNEEAEEKITEDVMWVENNHRVCSIYVVNVEEGKLAVVIDINKEYTAKGYEVDEHDFKKEVNYVNVEHTVYTFSYITEDATTTYYFTREYEETEGEEVVETTKYYHAYSNKNGYINAVGEILSHINRNMIEDGYFDITSGEIALFYGNMFTVEGSGSNAKAKLFYETFEIEDAEIIEMASELEISFKNNKLGEINTNSKMGTDARTVTASSKFHVEFTAENVNTEISLTGALEDEYLSIPFDELPELGGFGLMN